MILASRHEYVDCSSFVLTVKDVSSKICLIQVQVMLLRRPPFHFKKPDLIIITHQIVQASLFWQSLSIWWCHMQSDPSLEKSPTWWCHRNCFLSKHSVTSQHIEWPSQHYWHPICCHLRRVYSLSLCDTSQSFHSDNQTRGKEMWGCCKKCMSLPLQPLWCIQKLEKSSEKRWIVTQILPIGR